MNQDEINKKEWENPDNWTGPTNMSVYFSKKDSRTWVPKMKPWMGWTLNLGQPSGVRWLVLCIIGPIILVILVCTIIMAFLL